MLLFHYLMCINIRPHVYTLMLEETVEITWHSCFRIQLCIYIFKSSGINTLLLLLFEPFSIVFDTLQVASVLMWLLCMLDIMNHSETHFDWIRLCWYMECNFRILGIGIPGIWHQNVHTYNHHRDLQQASIWWVFTLYSAFSSGNLIWTYSGEIGFI